MALQFIHQLFTEHLPHAIQSNSFMDLLPGGRKEGALRARVQLVEGEPCQL